MGMGVIGLIRTLLRVFLVRRFSFCCFQPVVNLLVLRLGHVESRFAGRPVWRNGGCDKNVFSSYPRVGYEHVARRAPERGLEGHFGWVVLGCTDAPRHLQVAPFARVAWALHE